jgi:histidine ammonia-lyase
MITIIQAVDYLNMEPRMSSATAHTFRELRKIVPKFREDTIKYLEIKRIKEYLCELFVKIA